jgi:hypothetical protein
MDLCTAESRGCGDGGDCCGSGGPWKSTVEAVVTVPQDISRARRVCFKGGGNERGKVMNMCERQARSQYPQQHHLAFLCFLLGAGWPTASGGFAAAT